MNRAENKILSDATRAVAHHNKHLWWELKRQVWDFGYQSYYPRQGEYQREAELAVAALPTQKFMELLAIYTSRHQSDLPPTEQQVVRYYAALMIEEIVRRAGIAAYKTVNW